MKKLQIFKKIASLYKFIKDQLNKLSTSTKILIGFSILFLTVYLAKLRSSPIPKITTISISQFLTKLSDKQIIHANISPTTIIATDITNNILKSSYGTMPATILYNQLKNSKINFQYIGNKISKNKIDYLIFFTSAYVACLIYYFFLSGSSTHEKKSSKPIQKVTFNDLVGLDQAKQTLKQIIDYMMDPTKYHQRGARMRRGILLHGPSGTGKTTLAKACANQAGVPFYPSNAAQFCQIYVGMGPKKIRDLFAKAKKTAPCIIFIDQLDAFGSRTTENSLTFQSASSQKNSTINQILSQMDGFQTNDQVLVIAATNRLQMVDKSLIRSGRFDIKINIPLPCKDTKINIFNKYLIKTKHTLTNQFIQNHLKTLQFCNGADIQTLVNQAIYHSMRRSSNTVQQQDIINVIKSRTH